MVLSLLTVALAAPFEHTRLAVLDEAIAVPGTSLVSSQLHPGAVFGASVWSREGHRLAHEVAVEVGGYHHAALHTALWLGPVWQGTWSPHRSLSLSTAAILAYKHTFDVGTTWRPGPDGAYEAKLRPGHPGLSAQLGLGAHVRLTDRVGIYLQYRGSLDGPFSPELSPIMFHRTTHLGLEFGR